MADIWDGGTSTTGIIKTEFNTDHTAICYTRTDAGAWPPDIPKILTDNLIHALILASDALERLANDLDKIDTAFAATCRNQAAAYRGAGGISAATAAKTEPALSKRK